MHMMGYGSYWPMIMMAIIWIGLIVVAVVLIANFVNGGRKQRPLEIAKERLAKGEISEEEYDRLKQKLKDKQ
ncbi:SHOCT domain-containing protein [Lentibacillus cibarius]|uniref:SHOCT domain-containing protein n=2 Tax=Lentibacillus cibarius TaxID=2583219 RepID=A0A549YJS8_9BACI|nr:SHOCT domain-containing protein [Lentibacillus cibarius]TRM12143.1 SHOCT domain-containing protein [Lentibacillus cibarius]